MNKKLTTAGVVLLALVTYGGASWWLGKKVEERYDAAIDQAVAALGPTASVTRTYDRGLFSSKGMLVLEMKLPASSDAKAKAGAAPMTPQTIRVHVQNDVLHGPFPGLHFAAAAIDTHITAVDGIEDNVRTAFARADPPRIATVYGFAGGFSGQLALPAGEMADPTANAQWQRLDYDFKSNGDGTRIEGDMHWPQLRLELLGKEGSSPGVAVTVDQLKAQFQGERPQTADALMMTGEGHGTIGRIVVQQPGVKGSAGGEGSAGGNAAAGGAAPAPLLALDDLKFASKTSRNGELLEIVQSADASGSIGTQPISQIHLGQTLKNLNGPAVAGLQKLLGRDAQKAAKADPSLTAQGLEVLMNQLIDAKPEYRVAVSATFEGQQGELNYGLAFKDDPSAAGKPPGGAMPFQLVVLQRAVADATMRLPKAWLPVIARKLGKPELTPEVIAQSAATFKAQGLLEETDQAYTSKVQYAAGQVLVNGKPFRGLAGRK